MSRYLSREVVVIVASIVSFTTFVTFASAWTGPSASAPNSNIGAPINVGTTAQIKNGDLGANNISAFGNALLSGLGVGTGRYLNFDYTTGGTVGGGSAGYGIRDNAGTLEFKNNGGAWASLQATVSGLAGFWTSGTGGAIYYSGGSVGIGTASPTGSLEVKGTPQGVVRISSNDTLEGGELELIGGSSFSTSHMYIDNYSGRLRIIANNPVSEAMSILQNGNVGIGVSAPTQKLHVNGTVLATTFLYSSDARLKNNVAPLDTGLIQLMKLKPVSFTWNAKSTQAGQQDIGFIAQDVEKIVPGVVHTDDQGMKSIDYIKLTPILVNALQEQQKEIDALEARVQALENN